MTEDCDINNTLEALEGEDQLESTSTSQVPTQKDPSTGIHQAIVHCLYLNVCELHLNNHPRFYTGPKLPKTEPQEIYPLPLSGPDYLAIAVRQASTDFQGTTVDSPDIWKYHISSSPICRLHYSKAFPLSFGEFCHKVTGYLGKSDSESY